MIAVNVYSKLWAKICCYLKGQGHSPWQKFLVCIWFICVLLRNKVNVKIKEAIVCKVTFYYFTPYWASQGLFHLFIKLFVWVNRFCAWIIMLGAIYSGHLLNSTKALLIFMHLYKNLDVWAYRFCPVCLKKNSTLAITFEWWMIYSFHISYVYSLYQGQGQLSNICH